MRVKNENYLYTIAVQNTRLLGNITCPWLHTINSYCGQVSELLVFLLQDGTIEDKDDTVHRDNHML